MRAQLISDSFSLSQSIQVSPTLPLDVIQYLSEEKEYLPWNVFFSRSKYYTDLLDRTRINNDLQKIMRYLVADFYKDIEWVQDDTKHNWLYR